MNKAMKMPIAEPETVTEERDELLESLEETLEWVRGEKALRVTVRTKSESPNGDGVEGYSETVHVITGKEFNKVMPKAK
jgi:hypothetical protein